MVEPRRLFGLTDAPSPQAVHAAQALAKFRPDVDDGGERRLRRGRVLTTAVKSSPKCVARRGRGLMAEEDLFRSISFDEDGLSAPAEATFSRLPIVDIWAKTWAARHH